MAEGKDIFGNPLGNDVFGNASDLTSQGNRLTDVFGNVLKDLFGNVSGSDKKEEE